MKWVLIIWLSHGGVPGGIAAQEFDTELSCKAAGNAVQKVNQESTGTLVTAGIRTRYVCVEK